LAGRGPTSTNPFGFQWEKNCALRFKEILDRLQPASAWENPSSLDEVLEDLSTYDVVVVPDDHTDPLPRRVLHHLVSKSASRRWAEEVAILLEAVPTFACGELRTLREQPSGAAVRRASILKLLREVWAWPVEDLADILSDDALGAVTILSGGELDLSVSIARTRAEAEAIRKTRGKVKDPKAPDHARRPAVATEADWEYQINLEDANLEAVENSCAYLRGARSGRRQLYILFGQSHCLGDLGIVPRLRLAGFSVALVLSGVETPDALAWRHLGERAHGSALRFGHDEFWLGLLSAEEIVRRCRPQRR
jgi:hypothetical protein